ncbi:MAG: class B sortase [Angelakisella sp.]
MTNEMERETHRPRKLAPGLIAVLVCYLGVLGFAARTDVVAAQQQQQQLLYAQTQAIQQQNLDAAETARNDARLLQQTTAGVLSDIQLVYRQEQEEAARLAAEEKAKAEAAAAKANKPAPPPAPTVKFDLANYGDSGQNQLSYWKGINSDTIGYLRIPGFNISHAVVQNRQDVNYYTNRNYDKSYQKGTYGVLWTNTDTNSAGYSSNMSSNTVIYGHNWNNWRKSVQVLNPNNRMFDQLASYHFIDVARAFPYFYYSTSEEVMTFKLFAIFYTEPSFNYIQTEGNTQGIIEEALRRTQFNFDTPVNGSDKIITLSTCTRMYGATGNQRFVVMGRLLRPGESITPVTVTNNYGHKEPDVWNK